MKNKIRTRPFIHLTTVILAFGLFAHSSHAALNSYLALTANGTDIDGETTLNSIGGVDVSSNHIECLAVNHEIFTGTAGRATHAPIKIVKRVDSSSPLLYQALGQNQVIEGTFKYFRPNSDTGETEHYFTIEITHGRVNGIRHWFPNTIDAATANYPHMEEVSFQYQTLKIINVSPSFEYEFNVSSPL